MAKINKKAISWGIVLSIALFLAITVVLILWIYYDIKPAQFAYIDRVFG